MRPYTIRPLAVGINETDQGVMTYLRDYGRRIFLPIYAFYLEGGERRILVDTGLAEFVAPPGAEEACGFRILEFEEALATVGLKPEDVDLIVHTHLHNDHCENDARCPNAEIVVQRAEYEFMLDPHPVDHRYYPDILDDLNVQAGRRRRRDRRGRAGDLLAGAHGGRAVGRGEHRPGQGGHHRLLLQR